MKTVAIFARKGGVGKSTIAFNLSCHAARLGFDVLLISMDPQGDSVRWANKDRPLRLDDLFESEHGFKTLFIPYTTVGASEVNLSNIISSTKCDLIIFDMPPAAESIEHIKPDLWVIPVDGRNSIIDTLSALPYMKKQCPNIVWLPNRINAGGETAAKMIRESLSSMDYRILSEILDSAIIARVAETYLPVWEAPFPAAGVTMIVNACNEILTLCNLSTKPIPAKKTRRSSRKKG